MEKYGRTTKVVEAIMKTKLTITGEDFYINDKKKSIVNSRMKKFMVY